jgi:hypothetical protein
MVVVHRFEIIGEESEKKKLSLMAGHISSFMPSFLFFCDDFKF